MFTDLAPVLGPILWCLAVGLIAWLGYAWREWRLLFPPEPRLPKVPGYRDVWPSGRPTGVVYRFKAGRGRRF